MEDEKEIFANTTEEKKNFTKIRATCHITS